MVGGGKGLQVGGRALPLIGLALAWHPGSRGCGRLPPREGWRS